MASFEGNLTHDEVTEVTLSKRVYDVIVEATGGDIWVTSDGSKPGFGRPGSHRIVNGDTETIQVDATTNPTVLKLFCSVDAAYTITEGRAPEAEQSGAFASLSLDDGDPGDVPTIIQDPPPQNATWRLTASQSTMDGGTYTITFDGDTTDPIPQEDAGALAVVALEALPAIGVGNVAVDNGIANSPVIQLVGALAATPVDVVVTADGADLTGPDSPYTIAVAVVVPGIAAGPKALTWAQPWD